MFHVSIWYTIWHNPTGSMTALIGPLHYFYGWIPFLPPTTLWCVLDSLISLHCLYPTRKELSLFYVSERERDKETEQEIKTEKSEYIYICFYIFLVESDRLALLGYLFQEVLNKYSAFISVWYLTDIYLSNHKTTLKDILLTQAHMYITHIFCHPNLLTRHDLRL